jgi:hypothetical protein
VKAHSYCAATADNNLLRLPGLPWRSVNVALQPVYQPIFRSAKHAATNFLFVHFAFRID